MTSINEFVENGKLVTSQSQIWYWPKNNYSISPEIVDILDDEDVWSKVNEVRSMSLWTQDKLDSLFSANVNNDIQEKIGVIIENNSFILTTLFEKLGITSAGENDLFHSQGAVCILEWWKIYYTSLNDIGEDVSKSWVSKAYGTELLMWMSLQKASVASIFHQFKWQFDISTQLMQAVLWILGEESKHWSYYRWLYSHQGKSIWISGSFLPHEVSEKIMEKLDPFDAIRLDTIAPERNDKNNDESVWRVNLFAGIFDELLARLILHNKEDWGYHIWLVAEDIKTHFKKAQMNDNNELGKLC